jgi:hypothetical protein
MSEQERFGEMCWRHRGQKCYDLGVKVLLLHLSDIHIKTGEDVVLSRGDKIVDAVKNLEAGPDAIVCVISGDVTSSMLP